MAQSLGGAMLPPIVGLILDMLWNGTIQNGDRVYLLADYQHALLVLPLEMLLAGTLLYFIKETHCKEER